MSNLFKDNIKKSLYEAQIKDLKNAINNNNLEKFLFSDTDKQAIKHSPDRTKCEGFNDNATRGKGAEKRICKCLFYKNMEGINRKCETCILKNLYQLKDGKYKIINYEIPAYYSGNGIGEIDLVLSDGNEQYATEVKPPVKVDTGNNEETLLRMIAEITTYTLGFKDGTYNKAIGFFENTAQYEEYNEQNDNIIELLDLLNISVFLFKETKINNTEFEIIKLR